MHTELWPPLDAIRSAFESDATAAPTTVPDAAADCRHAQAQAGIAPPDPAPPTDPGTLLLPLIELARRRQAVERRAFSTHWAPGRLVSVVHQGRLLGVLLDRCIHHELWQGWMAAGELDWAGAFDVLLEPGDEPFEPMFGLVQTWNVLTLEPSPQLCARVLGEVSATRLAAIRAVHDEWTAQAPPAIAPEPGHIALRTVGGGFSVLSGTPLGPQDPRTDYQALYRDAALQLGTALRPDAAAVTAAPLPVGQDGPARGWWGSVRRWIGADGLIRPAFALLALCVVVQNAGLFGGHRNGAGDDGDEVRFRAVPTAPAAPVAADLVVRWQDGVRVDEADRLLRAASAEVIGGPDADGRWHLRLVDPVQGLALLAASPLVESAAPEPRGPP